MTFDKAYCKELDRNITVSAARTEFFARYDSDFRFTFFCPDKNCNVELTGVNIYIRNFKHKPHFRTKKNCTHSNDCCIVAELDGEAKKDTVKGTATAIPHGYKKNEYPDKLILSSPKKENQNKSEQPHDDFDMETREKRKSTTVSTNNERPYRTASLEEVVDSYEGMNEEKRKEVYITLNTDRKTYDRIFKEVKYFQDGKNFIFYGKIEPIKPYGKDYSIMFKDKVRINNESYRINIYITNNLISNYHLSELFRESIDKLTRLGSNSKNARCYFVGSYPKAKEVQKKNGEYFTEYKVEITNLAHLVIKFEE